MSAFFMVLMGLLFAVAEYICHGKKWFRTDKGNIWILYMVWFGGASFLKLILILNGVHE